MRKQRLSHREAEAYISMNRRERAADINLARRMRDEGKTLSEIASAIGRSKEWLREQAGIR